MRGQLASSVRGRWNSAGTSGREQRKYWGGGAKGAQREGQGKGVARTLLCQLTALIGSPTLGDPGVGAFLCDLGGGRAALKVLGDGKGGDPSPLASLS